jgi:hypothetical protein
VCSSDLKAFVKQADGTIVGNEKGTDITEYAKQINGEWYDSRTTGALKEFYGSSIPDVSGSFSLKADYRAFSLSAMFTYALGGKVYDGVYATYMSTGGNPSAYHSDLLKLAWKEKPEGMTADSPNRIWYGGTPQINSAETFNTSGTSSRWLVSGDYLVLKNITLGYKLPRSFVQRTLGLQSIGISATCENLFSLTARKGMNPQQSMSGMQYNYVTIPRVFSVGVNIKL